MLGTQEPLGEIVFVFDLKQDKESKDGALGTTYFYLKHFL
jgi:hypothetical protein